MKNTFTIFAFSFFLLLGLKYSIARSLPLQLNNKLIIILDIQEHFTDKISQEKSDVLIQNLNSLINNADAEDIIYVKSLVRVLNLSLKKIYVDTLAGMHFDKRLKIINDHIFEKTKSNAFTSDKLINYIKAKNINEIVVVGLLAEECLYETLIGGKKEGYIMYFIPEMTVGKSTENKEKILKKLKKKGITELSL